MYHEHYEEDLKDAKKILKDYAKQLKEMLLEEKGQKYGVGILTKNSHFNTRDGITLEYISKIDKKTYNKIPESERKEAEKNWDVTKLEPDSGTLN